MKILNASLNTLLIFTCLSCGMRNDYQKNLNLNEDWEFIVKDFPYTHKCIQEDSVWQKIDLPHYLNILQAETENIGDNIPLDFSKNKTLCYRKQLNIPADYFQKSVYLQLEGVFQNPNLCINGIHVENKSHDSTNIINDIGSYLNPEKPNVILLCLSNTDNINRLNQNYSILCNANLVVANKVHIPPQGTLIRGEKIDSLESSILITTHLINSTGKPLEVMLVSHIFHPEEGKVSSESSERFLLIKDSCINQILPVEIPDFWSPGHPVLYDLVSDILSKNNTIMDTYVSSFAIYETNMGKKKKMVLNRDKLYEGNN